MKKIKLFTYLDEYKLYSISSQLFQGLTEYIVHTKGQLHDEEETQKGPIGSGKLIADIFKEEKTTQEKKNLYDYAFNLLEDELVKNNNVLEINESKLDTIENANDFSFIKITGKAIFNDMKIVSKTIEEFNTFGEALGYLTMQESYKDQVQEFNDQLKDIKDRNQKAKAKHYIKSKSAYRQYLKDSGLILDDEFIKNLKYVLDFGYQGQFEVKIPFDDSKNKYLFSTILNRDYLKEEVFELISKYSRKTEKEFTIFGILTQNDRIFPKDEDIEDEEEKNYEESPESSVMKEAVLNIVDKLTNVETTFTGRLSYEYIIDPIAIYREI